MSEQPAASHDCITNSPSEEHPKDSEQHAHQPGGTDAFSRSASQTLYPLDFSCRPPFIDLKHFFSYFCETFFFMNLSLCKYSLLLLFTNTFPLRRPQTSTCRATTWPGCRSASIHLVVWRDSTWAAIRSQNCPSALTSGLSWRPLTWAATSSPHCL